MHESPVSVLRKKKDSSIVVATKLVRDEKASAVVSAGHTGATMASSLMILGPVKGVERPAIATILPTLEGVAIMLDVGANVDCKPKHLYQFAIMGHAYAVKMLQKENPRIGLLSIGEDDTRGKMLSREIRKSSSGKIGYLLLKKAFASFKKKVDYAEYGGAPLLGVNGVSIICHGRSTPKAIKNAIRMSVKLSEVQTVQYLQKDVSELMQFVKEDMN